MTKNWKLSGSKLGGDDDVMFVWLWNISFA